MLQWSLQEIAASPLPNLETLMVNDSALIEKAHVLEILAPSLVKRSLRSLSLTRCQRVDFQSLEWLAKHGENLEELAIGDNSTVTDEALQVVTKFKKLSYLDLHRSQISPTGLMGVVNGSLAALRELNISWCRNIDTDAAQVAATCGVKIIN